MDRICRIVGSSIGCLVVLAAGGCGPPPLYQPSGPPPGARGEPIQRKATTARVPMPIHRPAQFDRAALPDVVKANNAFAVDLYRALRTEPGNLLVSPASLTAGLAMLRAGGRGETAAEIDRVLHRSGPLADGGLAAMIRDLNADGPDACYQVRLADAVWFQQGYPILNPYRRTLRDVFAIDDETRVDFTGHPERASEIINDWIAGRTGGRIRGVLAPEAVKPPTKMVLTLALYFRGEWAHAFQEDATADAPFHVSPSETVTVPMMNQGSYDRTIGYDDRGSYRVVSLPSGRGAFSMVVFLPKKLDGLGDMEAALTLESIDAACSALKAPDEIQISLPRFRLKTSRMLNPALEALGLSRAFDRSRADFSGINGKVHDLFVAATMHETYIDVDESGIEASAATEIISTDAFGDDEPPPVVVIDHPFLYMIRDNRSGCIVFVGRVVNPAAAEDP